MKLDKEIKRRYATMSCYILNVIIIIIIMLFLNSATCLNICIIYIKWENILGRKERLQESHQLQLFKANQRLLLDWTLKQSDEMVKKGLPKNKTEAESFILEHQNWKVLKYL